MYDMYVLDINTFSLYALLTSFGHTDTHTHTRLTQIASFSSRTHHVNNSGPKRLYCLVISLVCIMQTKTFLQLNFLGQISQNLSLP